ncbi:MAG: PilT/PilU family type 4a pilus ATPase [Candidatus Aceula lacicola]|nr:PilT/PilU family type 4a pilus ATPase [Candidatus Aceula lacicola]
MKLLRFFKLMVEKEASDLFLRSHALPRARINGKVQHLDDESVSEADMSELLAVIFNDKRKRDILEQNKDVDFIYNDPDCGRFRINIFYQRTVPALVARYIKNQTKSFEDLNLPKELCEIFAKETRGLILACGPAGVGKTTTIASMIDYINAHQEKHIVTLEDPIEFLFKDKKSLINQRELGIDFYSYPMALRHVTQQSPDVIFVGTIRDEETMRAALSAAELGALVLATFHTNNAVQTLERIINFFPPHLHSEMSLQLSMLLKGVLSLRLLSRKDGEGRLPAYESMITTPTVARLIREQKVREIQSFINDGKLFGMKAFKQTLAKLVREGLVSEEDARDASDSRDEFDLELSGMKRL